MSKKYQTKKGKGNIIPVRELLFGEYYLIDEKKCLYKSIEDDGIYYCGKGSAAFVRQNARSADETLLGLDLQ